MKAGAPTGSVFWIFEYAAFLQVGRAHRFAEQGIDQFVCGRAVDLASALTAHHGPAAHANQVALSS